MIAKLFKSLIAGLCVGATIQCGLNQYLKCQSENRYKNAVKPNKFYDDGNVGIKEYIKYIWRTVSGKNCD